MPTEKTKTKQIPEITPEVPSQQIIKLEKLQAGGVSESLSSTFTAQVHVVWVFFSVSMFRNLIKRVKDASKHLHSKLSCYTTFEFPGSCLMVFLRVQLVTRHCFSFGEWIRCRDSQSMVWRVCMNKHAHLAIHFGRCGWGAGRLPETKVKPSN